MHVGRRAWPEAGPAAAQSASGNAAKAGISAGDTIIYTSSFFGDELWPADKLGFANSAINACPSPVAFVYVKVPTRALRSKTLLPCWTGTGPWGSQEAPHLTSENRAINACSPLVVFARAVFCYAEVALLQDLRSDSPRGSSRDSGVLTLQ